MSSARRETARAVKQYTEGRRGDEERGFVEEGERRREMKKRHGAKEEGRRKREEERVMSEGR